MDMSISSGVAVQGHVLSQFDSHANITSGIKRKQQGGALGVSWMPYAAALAGASIIAMMAAGVAKADDVSELRSEIRALTQRLAKVETQAANNAKLPDYSEGI